MRGYWSLAGIGAAVCIGIAGGVSAEDAPKVEGWAFEQDRVEEQLGRGLIAMPLDEGDVYLRWRRFPAPAARPTMPEQRPPVPIMG